VLLRGGNKTDHYIALRLYGQFYAPVFTNGETSGIRWIDKLVLDKAVPPVGHPHHAK
jgi:hypothetical protein